MEPKPGLEAMTRPITRTRSDWNNWTPSSPDVHTLGTWGETGVPEEPHVDMGELAESTEAVVPRGIDLFFCQQLYNEMTLNKTMLFEERR